MEHFVCKYKRFSLYGQQRSHHSFSLDELYYCCQQYGIVRWRSRNNGQGPIMAIKSPGNRGTQRGTSDLTTIACKGLELKIRMKRHRCIIMYFLINPNNSHLRGPYIPDLMNNLSQHYNKMLCGNHKPYNFHKENEWIHLNRVPILERWASESVFKKLSRNWRIICL